MTEEMYEPIDDHVDQAKGRAVWQYKGKTNWDALHEIHVQRIQVLEDLNNRLLVEQSLSNAVGVQLDLFAADYDILREGKSDEDFRVEIRTKLNLLRSSGQVNVLLFNLQRLVNHGALPVALRQVFPLTVLMWCFVNDFGDITSEEAARVNTAMQEIKAAGVKLEIGLQLNASAFIVSDNPSGGPAGQGVATLLDGSDGGAFVKSIVTSRASFSPTDIPELTLWLDSADEETISLRDSIHVTGWADKSGNGYNTTQGTSSLQPEYDAEQLNGLPVITFDGTEYLKNLSFFDLKKFSMFIVARIGGASQAIFDVSTAFGTNTGVNSFVDATDFLARVIDPAVITVTSPIFFPITHVFEIHLDGSQLTLYFNGVLKDTQSSNQLSNTLTQLTIGALFGGILPVSGIIAEVALYKEALSTTEKQRLRGYLFNKWGF